MRTFAILAACSLALAGQTPAAKTTPPAAAVAQAGTQTVDVVCDATAGNSTVTVHPDWAPLGAHRFLHLVALHYYDGNAFFRVIAGFVAQWGLNPDPHATAAWLHRTIADDPVRQSNLAGRISFAASGKNSRTTEVFINLADNQRLDKAGFAPFGEVTAGMGNVRLLSSDYGDAPPQGHGPEPRLIIQYGAVYLTRNFPRLDVIYTCSAASTPGPAPLAPPKE